MFLEQKIVKLKIPTEGKVKVSNVGTNRFWLVFREVAIQENHITLQKYTPSVKSYISKFVNDVVTKDIKNRKPG